MGTISAAKTRNNRGAPPGVQAGRPDLEFFKTVRKFSRTFRQNYVTALEFTIANYEADLKKFKGLRPNHIIARARLRRRLRLLRKIIKETREKKLIALRQDQV